MQIWISSYELPSSLGLALLGHLLPYLARLVRLVNDNFFHFSDDLIYLLLSIEFGILGTFSLFEHRSHVLPELSFLLLFLSQFFGAHLLKFFILFTEFAVDPLLLGQFGWLNFDGSPVAFGRGSAVFEEIFLQLLAVQAFLFEFEVTICHEKAPSCSMNNIKHLDPVPKFLPFLIISIPDKGLSLLIRNQGTAILSCWDPQSPGVSNFEELTCLLVKLVRPLHSRSFYDPQTVLRSWNRSSFLVSDFLPLTINSLVHIRVTSQPVKLILLSKGDILRATSDKLPLQTFLNENVLPLHCHKSRVALRVDCHGLSTDRLLFVIRPDILLCPIVYELVSRARGMAFQQGGPQIVGFEISCNSTVFLSSREILLEARALTEIS